jgi:hypothetical protein
MQWPTTPGRGMHWNQDWGEDLGNTCLASHSDPLFVNRKVKPPIVTTLQYQRVLFPVTVKCFRSACGGKSGGVGS